MDYYQRMFNSSKNLNFSDIDSFVNNKRGNNINVYNSKQKEGKNEEIKENEEDDNDNNAEDERNNNIENNAEDNNVEEMEK